MNSNLTLRGCTLFGNLALEGGGISSYGNVTVENSIIAFSGGGGAVACSSAPPQFSCSDLFGNVGGDWTACVEDQLGINGNISKDPLFCNAPNHVFTLNVSSPCATENSPGDCGQIGAWPVACGVTSVGAQVVEHPASKLRLHPNPVQSTANFVFDRGATGIELGIYDIRGVLIELLRPIGNQVQWRPAATTPNGIYFARLRGRGVSAAVKFLVIR